MAEPLFMSPEHVARMNEILEGDAAVRSACAELPQPYTLGYALSGGPGGRPVHWTVTFTDTVRFSLEPRDTDLLLSGDWASVVRASRAQREGEVVDPGVSASGDLAVMQAVSPLLALAGGVATIPVTFPDV